MKEVEEVKMILLGESGVGKTSIIKRYLYDKFNEEHIPNISMNYAEKDIKIDKKTIKLNIWDTIGQEKYRSVSKMFLKETKIIILVYSINDSKSFEELNYWNDLYQEQIGKNVILGIAGNKNDLFLEQQVSEAQGRKYAEDNNAIFGLLSAKDNIGINDYILKLVNQYLEMKNALNVDDFEIIERERGITLSRQKLKDLGYKEEGCCGGKAKKRRKKYEEILKNNNGYIESVFLGANGVGKTSLIKAIIGKKFDENEKHTDELIKYETKYTNENMEFILNIYDIYNDDKKNKQNELIIKKCNIFYLVYDLCDMRSISEVKFWLKAIENCRKEEKKNVVIAIIANKNDLINNENKLDNKINKNNDNNINKDKVAYLKKGEILANEIDAIFYQTSAKNDKNIKEVIGISIEKFVNNP